MNLRTTGSGGNWAALLSTVVLLALGDSVSGQAPEWFSEPEKTPVDRLSQPYQYRSLRGATDEALWTFMSATRDAGDYQRDWWRAATEVKDFWSVAPADAAMAYVRANRPPAIAPFFRLFFDGEAAAPVPEEGDVTVTDGPSGCGAPRGVYLHHLHCAAGESYLAAVSVERRHPTYVNFVSDLGFNVRKLSLPDELARHLLQTIWWLERVRSERLPGSPSAEYASGGSTSDGPASVYLQDKGTLRFRHGLRTGIRGTFRGLGIASAKFDDSAFLNLVIQLFEREIPERLGPAWEGQAVPSTWSYGQRSVHPEDVEGVRQQRARTGELLSLAAVGKLPPTVTTALLWIAGESGWREVRPIVAQTAAGLPAPSQPEREVLALYEQTDELVRQLGPEAEEHASLLRSLPSDTPTGGSGVAKAALPTGKNSLEEVDAIWARLRALSAEAPRQIVELWRLRRSLPQALRQLEVYADEAALVQWAREETGSWPFTIPRLMEVAPDRVLGILQQAAARMHDDFLRDRVLQGCEQVKTKMAGTEEKKDRMLSPAERKAAMAVLVDESATRGQQEEALFALVPSHDPRRYPDPAIDAALVKLWQADAGAEWGITGLDFLLARRHPEVAWDYLLPPTGPTPPTKPPQPARVLSGLTSLALRTPGVYEPRMRDLLAPELQTTAGHLDDVLLSIWALNLRSLRPEVVRLATGGPSDYEGLSIYSSTQRQPLTQRYHRARQVAALWDEEDAQTRAKLLVAFAMVQALAFSPEQSDLLLALERELKAAASDLTTAQRESVLTFGKWCHTRPHPYRPDRLTDEEAAPVLAAVKAALSGNPPPAGGK